MLLTLRELCKKYPGGQLPLLDPVADMGVQDEAVAAAAAEAASVRQRLKDNPLWQVGGESQAALRAKLGLASRAARCAAAFRQPPPRLVQAEQGTGDPSQLAALRKKSELVQEGEALKKRMRESQLVRCAVGRSFSLPGIWGCTSLACGSSAVGRSYPAAGCPTLLPLRSFSIPKSRSFKVESKHRTEVLRKLGFIDGQGNVTVKGRAACEIDTAGGRGGGWGGWGGCGLGLLRLACSAAQALAQARQLLHTAPPSPPNQPSPQSTQLCPAPTDELVTVEMMFDGTFGSLDIHQLVALVSCLVPVDRSNVRGIGNQHIQKKHQTAKLLRQPPPPCGVACAPAVPVSPP